MHNVLQNVLELLACKKMFTRDCKLYKLGSHLFLQLFDTSKCCTSLLGEQECPSCKICYMENILRTFLLFLSFLRQPHVIKKTVVSPFLKQPTCLCFCRLMCKSAQNETFVSCRTFLRTFSELQLFVASIRVIVR